MDPNPGSPSGKYDSRHRATQLVVGAAEDDLWQRAANALAAGAQDEAAYIVLRTALLPGMVRQLQHKWPRLPHSYVDDAIADAIAETFTRLAGGASVAPKRLGGYIFTTADYILQKVQVELRNRRQLVDAEQTPYDDELVERFGGLGQIGSEPIRTKSLGLLVAFVDQLPSSDSAKAVLRVRFEAAGHGDWLTDAEVADILGRERSSISSWYRRGLADLRALCAEHGIDRQLLDDLAEQFDEAEGEPDDDIDDMQEEL